MPDSLQIARVSVRSIKRKGEPVILFARSHRAELGPGWSFDIKEPAITGAEQLLGLLASDVMGLFTDICRKRRLVIDEIEATLKAELINPLSFLGVIGAEGEPQYDFFSLKAYIGTSAPLAEVDDAWQASVARAPLANTLRKAGQLEISYQII